MFLNLNNLCSNLARRPDSEHTQVLVRIAITALFCAYLGIQVAGGESSLTLRETWVVLAGELLVSIWLMLSIVAHPGVSHARRWTGIVADYAALAAVMWLQGEAASPLYGVYLWVTIGNGLRYGPRYLHAATALATFSFAIVILATPYWQVNHILSWGLLVGLLAVPLYFASLLQAMTEAIAEARRANEAKTRFLANMSHELRTPLNSILGMSELLATSGLNREQRESAEMVRTSAQALLLLIEDVLDISAIEAGKLSRQDNDFNLPETLSRIHRMLKPQAMSKGLTLAVELEPQAPSELHGDAGHLTQILLNIVQNAIKFTQQGSVTVQVRELSRTDGGVRLRFSVRDTGIGIPEEARNRIFMPFEQVDNGRDRRFGGSGLGVTIAKNLSELMGGRIAVEDNPGGGTHFWMDLPFGVRAASEAVVEDAGGTEDVAVRADSTPQPVVVPAAQVIEFDDPFVRHRVRVRSLRVIVVDDQAANRLVMQRLLDRAGHVSISANDGEEGLNFLLGGNADLIFVDLHMPGTSGLDVIRQARVMQAGQVRRTPVVVLSADATVEARREAEQAGAYAYLTKPISVPRLLELLAAIASGDPAARGPASVTPMPAPAVLAEESVEDGAVSGVLQELAAMGLGEAFMREFVEQCARDIGRSMSLLQSAIASRDYESAREHAHAMRGVAENIGVDKVIEQCRTIMRADEETLSTRGVKLVRDLDHAVEVSVQAARTGLSKMLASSQQHQKS